MPAVMVPRVDGDYLPDMPAKLVAEKRYHEVDLMTGVTKDEGALVSLGECEISFSLPPYFKHDFSDHHRAITIHAVLQNSKVTSNAV